MALFDFMCVWVEGRDGEVEARAMDLHVGACSFHLHNDKRSAIDYCRIWNISCFCMAMLCVHDSVQVSYTYI